MEDDDEFGDLYTDVIQSFPSSSPSSFAAPLQKPSVPAQSGPRAIDLNFQLDDEDGDDECGDAPAGTSNSGVARAASGGGGLELNLSGAAVSSGRESDVRDRGVGDDGENRELGKTKESGGDFDEGSFRFDLEEEAQDGNGDVGSEPVIPGLSAGSGSGGRVDDLGREEAGGDDWDSDDSEDDLQIVLNDTNHGPLGMEMGGMLGGELDDGQDEGLGIGADGDGMSFQHAGMEEQDWGEDGAQAADGEKKEGGEAAKMNAGIAMAQKPGYVGHGYHPFHSQFKYVRPGAAPLQGAPAAGPVGAPGQVRPPVNIGPMAGRGRGDWRPPGMKNVPGVQKGHAPAWGNNAGGRGFGIGLDFTLPSHKTIFEVDIDGFILLTLY
uniref:Uncharacterized protein n=1 Tax=Kalanchoe fedtschenkoi TaxID=63787 RepID=A0A7N0RAK0_KALFE